jgi:hypothetical protein
MEPFFILLASDAHNIPQLRVTLTIQIHQYITHNEMIRLLRQAQFIEYIVLMAFNNNVKKHK